MSSDEVRTILYSTNNVSIYGIPPLKSTKGRKAADWDVSSPLWTGSLKVIEIDRGTPSVLSCEISLEDSNTNDLFAVAPYSSTGHGVDPTLDSSRYFAITLVNGSQHAIMGLGFSDRSEAFDFNIALQDFLKHSKPMETKSRDFKDLSLKDGETITIGVGSGSSTISHGPEQTHEAAPIPSLLPPPPSGRKSRRTIESFSEKLSDQSSDQSFEDDFGDFQG